MKDAGSWAHQSTSMFEYGGGPTVIESATRRNDECLLTRIRDKDLFACEARYHPACRKKYTSDPRLWNSQDQERIHYQASLEDAHAQALQKVLSFITESIILKHEITQLSNLQCIYVKELQQTSHENPNHRSEKLKDKLMKHPTVGPELEFTLVETGGSTLPFYLVFSSRIKTPSAITKAYQLASKDPIREVALVLRGAIKLAYQQSHYPQPRWPPDTQELIVEEGVIPSVLQRFLSLVLSNTGAVRTARAERILLSIGQNICRAVTNGEWKLPKHILLCATLRHLFRSTQVVTMLNRLGHCENNTFASELEAAIDTSLQNASSLLTNQIVRGPRNILFHSEWDNFNQRLSGVHGTPMCNTSGGIMLQEVNIEVEVESDDELQLI